MIMPSLIDAVTNLPIFPPPPALPINDAKSDDDGDEEATNAGAYNLWRRQTMMTTILTTTMNLLFVPMQTPGHLLLQLSTLSPPT